MTQQKKKVVIIGGGITGVTTAYYLQKEIKMKDLPIETVLIEASDRLGGKIQTYTENGYVIEKGPDSLLARKLSASRLAAEVGLTDQIVRNGTGKSYVLVKDKLHPMPGGSIMGIPTKITPFAFSGLFSPLGKLRAGLDLVIPRSSESGDQSLGKFFRRRLGDEVVDHLIEPLLSGIYAGDIDQMSLLTTFPEFFEVEKKYRSLVLGMKQSRSTAPKPKGKTEKKPGGMFISLSGGLESLVQGIEAKLETDSVKKNVLVEKVERLGDLYKLQLSAGEDIIADSVVVTIPHQQTAKIFADYSFFEPFKSVPSTSVANVAMAFPESAIKKDIDGTGFVVSRDSDYCITAVTWTHKKWPHSTPKGKALLRCYVGKPGDEEIVSKSDDEIIEAALKDLNKTMDITMKPELTVITRWHNGMPQYTVGHKDRMKSIKEAMDNYLPGIFLAGASYEGLAVPDCIDQGEEAVRKVLTYLMGEL
ncbi:protoporphyrinogen oxidase [Calidifontibacillus oryziterrae]|uniref:protoporphyrinogen oxidase n=1 Tax=Calidifontibacillus oryziterrae TaxID=1191699 RepID=UPI0003034B24|nr:protoporphyrinogen oxidase [Calidifontibacillus oryziterrae]